jgi:putative Holliday junction resolvase
MGLAVSDFHAILASPLATVNRGDNLVDTISQVLDTAAKEGEYLEIYVGVPVNLKGEVTLSTSDAVEFAVELERLTQVPVLLVDERLTTVVANNQLKQIGKTQKQARGTIDQMAAVAILEFALSVEGATGSRPGLSVRDWRLKYE